MPKILLKWKSQMYKTDMTQNIMFMITNLEHIFMMKIKEKDEEYFMQQLLDLFL